MDEEGDESKDLHYGSLGKVSYDGDNNSWTCQRLPTRLCRTQVLTCDSSIQDQTNKRPDSRSHDGLSSDKSKAELLAEFLPDLAGALPLVHRVIDVDRRTGEPLVKATDENTGPVLAFGMARGIKNDIDRSLQIIAYPRGRNRDDLCIAQLMPVLSSPESSDDSLVSVQRLHAVPSSIPTWHCTSGPILQVSSSDSTTDAYTFLAVRSWTSLHVLRPRATRWPARDKEKRMHIDAHVMAAEKVVDIRLARLLDSTCTDLAFNPWYQRQLVVVDDSGMFAIVQISPRKAQAGLFHWNMLSSGRIPTRKIKSVPRRSLFCVNWVRDVQTFVIAGGHSVCVLDVRNTDSPLASLEVSTDVVDLRSSPFYKDDFFVLTGTHVEWLRLHSQRHGNSEILKVAAWRHYFESPQAAIKLAFSQREDDVESGSVLIYAQSNFLVAEYPVGNASEAMVHGWITCPPSSFGMSSSLRLPTRVLDMHLLPVPFVGNSFDTDLPRASFHQLFLLDVQNNLNAYMCRRESQSVEDEEVLVANITRRRRWQKNVRLEARDDWLVSDDESAASGIDEAGYLMPSRASSIAESASRSRSSLRKLASAEQHAARGISHAYVYQKLSDENHQPAADLSIEMARSLSELQLGSQRVYLAERLNTFVTVNDLDRTTALFKAMTHDPNEVDDLPEGVRMQRLGLPTIDHLSFLNDNRSALSDMYDSIVRKWITPLSDQVPARTRVRLEQAARSMAASLWLSSHLIGDKTDAATHDKQMMTASVRPQTASEQPLHDFQDLSLFPDPLDSLPSQSSVHDSQTSQGLSPMSGARSMLAEAAADANDAASAAVRLTRYTKLERPPSSSVAVAGILDHWSEGTDPSLYDYKAKVAEASGTVNIAGSQMSAETYARQQRKLKRQEERRLQRQKKQLGSAQALARTSQFSLPSSQSTMLPPQVQMDRPWQSSQPTVMPGPSSSQANQAEFSGSQMPHMASQVQPGRHGARPLPGSLAMRAKNKRKAGF